MSAPVIRQTTPYGISTTVRRAYQDVVPRVREALAAHGFGVLTEIDVAATLQRKLGVAFRPYLIFGACNPPLAHQALTAELDIGLLLPCNVTVYAADDPSETVVGVMDPVAALRLTANPAIEPLARDVRGRLERVLAAVAA